jgi:hypothetical protein
LAPDNTIPPALANSASDPLLGLLGVGLSVVNDLAGGNPFGSAPVRLGNVVL